MIDVSALLEESFDVTVVNFDFARRYPKDPKEIRLRLDALRDAFGERVSLARLSATSLRLPLERLWRGSWVERAVDRYLHFLPLDPVFLKILRRSHVVYFVGSQGSPAYLLVGLGMAIVAGWKPVVAGIHVTPRATSAELAALKLAAKAGVLRAFHLVNPANRPLLESVGCPIEYIPNGVHYDRFYGDVEAKAFQEDFRVLFVGAMTGAKGADLLPEICRSLEGRGVEFELEICTSGGELADATRGWSAGKQNVHYNGFVRRGDLPKRYRQASVALFPSRKEGFPLACLEVQASGTPAVISSVPGLTQALADPDAGRVVKGWDPDSFGRAVAEIYSLWKSDRQGYLAFCRRAQKNVRENFQWGARAEEVGDLLRRVMR